MFIENWKKSMKISDVGICMVSNILRRAADSLSGTSNIELKFYTRMSALQNIIYYQIILVNFEVFYGKNMRATSLFHYNF